MEKTLAQAVRTRADHRCEYCHIPQTASRLAFPIDHIIARQHGGATDLDNLAFCCGRCNRQKGPNIAGIDSDTGQLTRLFNPRKDTWSDHFRHDGAMFIGLTAIGRATIRTLAMNHPKQLAVRHALIEAGTLK